MSPQDGEVRAQFEAEMCKEKRIEGYVLFAKFADGRYDNLLVQASWQAWQASRRAAFDRAIEIADEEAREFDQADNDAGSYGAERVLLRLRRERDGVLNG